MHVINNEVNKDKSDAKEGTGMEFIVFAYSL